ncbi:hypothetical protein GAY28_02880 [Azospirillum brasilense]|nr:hypothetical protein [Azospirillum brasilense]
MKTATLIALLICTSCKTSEHTIGYKDGYEVYRPEKVSVTKVGRWEMEQLKLRAGESSCVVGLKDEPSASILTVVPRPDGGVFLGAAQKSFDLSPNEKYQGVLVLDGRDVLKMTGAPRNTRQIAFPFGKDSDRLLSMIARAHEVVVRTDIGTVGPLDPDGIINAVAAARRCAFGT